MSIEESSQQEWMLYDSAVGMVFKVYSLCPIHPKVLPTLWILRHTEPWFCFIWKDAVLFRLHSIPRSQHAPLSNMGSRMRVWFVSNNVT